MDAYRLGVSGRWVVLVLAEESVLLAGHGCHDSLGLGARVDCRHGVGSRRESCEGEHRGERERENVRGASARVQMRQALPQSDLGLLSVSE